MGRFNPIKHKLFIESIINHLHKTYSNPELLYNNYYNKNININNFHSYRIYLLCTFYQFLYDGTETEKWDELKNLFIEQCKNNLNFNNESIDENIFMGDSTGLSFDFFHRDSILYHEYNMQALFFSHLILKTQIQSDEDLYKYIKASIFALIPFYKHEREHVLYKNSHLKSDSHKKLYLKLYDISYSNKHLINEFKKHDDEFRQILEN
jgi:hypothetical protein